MTGCPFAPGLPLCLLDVGLFFLANLFWISWPVRSTKWRMIFLNYVKIYIDSIRWYTWPSISVLFLFSPLKWLLSWLGYFVLPFPIMKIPTLSCVARNQHPWYWLCRISKFLSYTRKDLNYLVHVIVEEWCKLQLHFIFPMENLKGLIPDLKTAIKLHLSQCFDFHPLMIVW